MTDLIEFLRARLDEDEAWAYSARNGGPAAWGDIQVEPLLDGTYEALHAELGLPTPLTEADRDRAREALRP